MLRVTLRYSIALHRNFTMLLGTDESTQTKGHYPCDVVHLGRRIIFKDVILGFLTRENLIDEDKRVLVLDSGKCVIATWSFFSSVLHRGAT